MYKKSPPIESFTDSVNQLLLSSFSPVGFQSFTSPAIFTIFSSTFTPNQQASTMESLSTVSTSIVLPPVTPLRHRYHHHHRRRINLRSSSFSISSFHTDHRHRSISSFATPSNPRLKPHGSLIDVLSYKLNAVGIRGGSSGEDGEEENDDEVERALRLDGTIPGSSNEFVEQVSSRAYDMRRHLQQTFDSSSYDVLEANPWREDSKAVYVLTRRENQLCTMKTRMNRSEVETELGMLFSKSRKRNQTKKPTSTKFQMLVEDVRDGVLVFEDEIEAAKYCDLLQGNCEGVAEIEASSVFDLCQKMRALAVLFRRGTTPPLPESLKLNLSARKRSLEDQDD